MIGQNYHFVNNQQCRKYFNFNNTGSDKAKNPFSGYWSNSPLAQLTDIDKKFGAKSYRSSGRHSNLIVDIDPRGLLINFWFKTPEISSIRGLFALMITGTTTRIQATVDATGRISTGILKNNSSILSAVVYQNCIYNEWVQYTIAIYDKLYYGQNGIMVSRDFVSQIDFTVNELIVGSYQDSTTFIWPGYIDEFMMFSKTVPISQLSTIQNREI